MNAKEQAGQAALEFVQSGMTLGLGTGSTAECFVRALAGALRGGSLRDIRGVPTSRRTAELATSLGIALVELADHPALDLTIDGADEIDPQLNLVKGLGGALLREKIIAQAARRLLIIADESKLVPRLGTRSPLPVEVVAFAHAAHVPFLRSLGCEPTLRRNAAGDVYLTDNGNPVYDCRFAGGINDPAGLERKLSARAGVVETGLFLNMADVALVAGNGGIRHIERPRND